MNRLFPYALGMKFVPMWLTFGVRPSKDGVTITDDGMFRRPMGSYGWRPARERDGCSHHTGLSVVDRHRGSDVIRR